MAFRCVIVTPEQQVLDASATQVILPAHDGLLGILSGRAPLLVKLGIGPLQVDAAGGGRQSFFMEGGVAQMKDNELTILTSEATPASELDAEAARAEYAEAAARRITDEKSYADRERGMQRGRVKQDMAARR
jgi:F-type H+-transporting ATPase subunit epsilon